MDSRTFLGLEPTHNPYRWTRPSRPASAPVGTSCSAGVAWVPRSQHSRRRPSASASATAQYLSYAKPGEVVDIDVTLAVVGHQMTQARAVCHVGNREILTVNATLGDRAFELAGQWETLPADLPRPVGPPRPSAPHGLEQHDQ